MLKPREQLRAQHFPDSYIVADNQGEQTMQAGNAVSANVAHAHRTAELAGDRSGNPIAVLGGAGGTVRPRLPCGTRLMALAFNARAVRFRGHRSAGGRREGTLRPAMTRLRNMDSGIVEDVYDLPPTSVTCGLKDDVDGGLGLRHHRDVGGLDQLNV
jgi:C-5 cytosine-specific DNA methylase